MSTVHEIGDTELTGLASPPSSSTPSIHPFELSTFRSANGLSAQGTSTIPSPLQGQAVAPHQAEEEDRRESSAASYEGVESAHMSFRDSRAGFLGPTSYNAVFTENPASLSVISEPHDLEDSSRLPPVTAERIQQGVEVLRLLRDMPIYQRFTQRWFDLFDGTVAMVPAMRIWIDDLWSEFGDLLEEGKPEQLRALSELVWRNTRKPLKVHGQMTASEWARSASGRNLRWEVVGTVFSFVGIVAANLSNWDSIFDFIRERFVDRATFAERMRKASEFCLCFCFESEVLNDNYVTFIYLDLILVECIKGEARLSDLTEP